MNRETVSKIREMFGSNIQYLEYDPETEKYGGDIYRKWSDAVQYVETEYSEFCTDKEFLVPTTLCKCIEFLDGHPEFSIAEGMDYQISLVGKEIIFSSWQGETSLEQDTPEKRFAAYIQDKDTLGNLFSVQRARNQKKGYANLEKYHIWDIRFGETALEIQPLIFGKTRRFIEYVSNCRDVSKVYTQSLLMRKTHKNESSFLRYLPYGEYPASIVSELSTNLGRCFDELYSEIILQKESGNVGNAVSCSTYVLQLMERRYPTHPLRKKLKFLMSTWEKLPRGLRHTIFTCIGIDDTLKIANKTGEMELIWSVIEKYDYLYEQDRVIFYAV